MVEIRLVVDEIDYSGIAKLVMPIVKEKLAEQNKGLGKIIGKHVPEAAMSGALNGLLQFMTPTQRDDIVIKLIAKYDDKIIDILQNTAIANGVKLELKDLSVTRIDEIKSNKTGER